MARRQAQGAERKRASAREQSLQSRAKPKPVSPDGALKERLAAIERERDALLVDLQRAEARVRSLEKVHAQVRDRIAWALDSLHNVLEGKG